LKAVNEKRYDHISDAVQLDKQLSAIMEKKIQAMADIK